MLRDRGGAADIAEADAMLADSDETYRQLGLDHWVTSAVGPRADKAVFRRDGELWLVAYQGRQARVRDSKGMAVLHRLLAEPHREFSVLNLAAPGRPAELPGDTGEVIDARAAKQIRAAIARIETAHPALALHLTNSVRTGRYCSDTPEQRVTWTM